MSPSADAPAPAKIAIKGFSLSSKTSSKAPPSSSKTKSNLGKRSRSTFGGHDSDDAHSSSDDTYVGSINGRGKIEVVSGFEDGGAVAFSKNGDGKGREKKGELVIPGLKNRDWKNEARGRRIGGNGLQRAVVDGRKNLLPPEVQAARDAAKREKDGEGKEEGVDVVNSKDGEIEWGLSVRKRVKGEDGDDTSVQVATQVDEDKEVKEEQPPNPKTADEEALAALLGTNTTLKRPDLIIPSTDLPNPSMSETDTYRAAILSAPEPSTLADYDLVPVEEFGAALLRGMGWKGESHGKVKDVKRRQNLLGLGATELKEAEELGAWVQKSDVKRLRPGGGGGSGGARGGERKVRVSEYKREEERRREVRDERGGGSYRREKERDRRDERERDRDGYRDRRR